MKAPCVDSKKVRQDALLELVPFVQFKKCEKHSWRNFTFNKIVG